MLKNYKFEFVRGFAAIIVFLSHLIGNNELLRGKDFGILSSWGTEAVIVFFVLSGNVIGISYLNNSNSIWDFFKKRFLRLYPLFFLSLFLSLILLFSFESVELELTHLIKFLFFLGTLGGEIVLVPHTNVPIWSLSFEVFFYVVFSLMFILKTEKYILVWFLLAILMIPFYYMNFAGVAKYLIMHVVFSFPWIIGYWSHKHAKSFNYFSFYQVMFALTLIPLISRLDFTGEIYCIVKYDLFSLCLIPFFIYSNNMSNCKCPELKYRNFNILFGLTYILLVFSFIYLSDSRFWIKIIYISLPIIAIVTRKFVRNFLDKYNKHIVSLSVALGSLSYGLYITHYPVLYVLNELNLNMFQYLIAAIILSFLAAYFFDRILQLQFNRMANIFGWFGRH